MTEAKSDTAKSKPELTLIQAAASAPEADPFDPENLRMDLGAAPVTQKLMLTIPTRRPGKTEFFRVWSDIQYRITTLLLNYDREFYLIAPGMREHVPMDCCKLYTLYPVMNRTGDFTFWPIRLPDADERENLWWSSAREAAKIAEAEWIRLSPNKAMGAYEVHVAEIRPPEPKWPEKSMKDLLTVAFGKQIVSSPDHEILKILEGRV